MVRRRPDGPRGVGFGLVNYFDELPFFCTEVRARLEARGVR
jgi:hypothetical protein